MFTFLKNRLTVRGYRSDGKLANVDYFQKFLPFIMKTRSASCIYQLKQFNMEEAKNFLKSFNEKNSDIHITPFALFMTAMVKVAFEYPKLNRFIAAKRIYDRNELIFCYVIKTSMELEGQEVVVKQKFTSKDTLISVANKIIESKKIVKETKKVGVDKAMKKLSSMPRFILSSTFAFLRFLDYFGMVPKSVIEDDALYSSAFITNVGSFTNDPPFHHMFDFGTTSIFIALGKLEDKPTINQDKTISINPAMDVTFTLDERIADGFYYAKALDKIEYYLKNPKLLL